MLATKPPTKATQMAVSTASRAANLTGEEVRAVNGGLVVVMAVSAGE
jgi:hypothetical protein